MDEKMLRFLSSIHLESPERFDLSFDYAGWKDNSRKVFIMAIAKGKPWEYPLLEEFQMALGNCSYEYEIRFSYNKRPKVDDAIRLLEPWYYGNYRHSFPYMVKEERGDILISYRNADEEKKGSPKMREFANFLKWINYPFEVKEATLNGDVSLEPEDEEDLPSLAIAPEIEEVPAEDIMQDELGSFELDPEEAQQALLEKDREREEEELKKTQEEVIRVMEENQKAMEAARAVKARFRKAGEYQPIEDISLLYEHSGGAVDVDGYVFEADYRVMRSGRATLNFSIHDDRGAMPCKVRPGKSLTEEILKKVKPGQHYRVRGMLYYDDYTHQQTIQVHFMDPLPPKKLREDSYEGEKRVELHLHSKMSTMDGVGELKDYAALAKSLGMDAMAITDHGCVQAFPDAQKVAKDYGLNMIYGCELYMFDLKQRYTYNPAPINLEKAKFCIFDLETTGLSSRYDRITEFGAVFVENGLQTDSVDMLINPGVKLSEFIVKKTRITDEMLKDCPSIEEAMPKIEKLIEGCVLVSHNMAFDFGFLNEARRRMGLEPFKNPVIDTLALSHYLFPKAARHSLGALSKNLQLEVYDEDTAHRADADAGFLYSVWMTILNILWKQEPQGRALTHADLDNLKSKDNDIYKHLRTSHVTVLCRDKKGMQDLYRLATEGNLTYLAQVPKTPREEINAYREHLLVGSACQNGEIFDIARTRSEDELLKAMEFYDYIEIQPLENYVNLINQNSLTEEEVFRTVKDIYEAAKKLDKIIVATGDVHYVDPEDKIIRDVFIQALGIGKGRHPLNPFYRDNLPRYENPDQHFRSTSEMLDSFRKWLPEDECKKIVIDNTRYIASLCENLEPVMEGTFPPNANLPDSAKQLEDLVYTNFKKRYGDNPPEELKERLKMELDGIIGNGYSVTYMIAYRIIQKAQNEPEHYIVGSRGSVGSSFVATMADITEVNPLAPHYLCPHCHHFEWGKDSHPEIRSGFDLPDKDCPECGHKMIHDGQNIPFQTFLGFHAEKVPDIDLNFPPDYQAKAHAYMRTLLGENNVFRAGTIETVANKTAFGYVRGYYEDIGIDPNMVNRTWMAYIASRCEGVKRTTGQHPGGIVVIPADRDKFEFTPIQYPADDVTADWMTTHFDFGSMHDELLKIDLLGHVDPLATRLMSLYTGVDLHDIPMNDKKVLSLFDSEKELKLKRNYLNEKTGTLGVPEFGTTLAQQMLQTCHPKCFNDLLIISGLAHGTEVWTGNAETLITSGVSTLQGVIGCRDDIMSYLISMGVPSAKAFKMMEAVRKGRGLTKEDEQLMRDCKIPDYYINSCKKIRYLFPRAHATAYVMMAVRVCYFKLYYPLDFYAVFFSVRSDDWDIETMVAGEEAIIAKLEEYNTRKANDRNAAPEDKIKPKDTNINKTLTIALEMVERGYKFEHIDLYKSDATMFLVDKENNALIPPFSIVDGLGEAAARSVVEARKEKSFLSKEDLLKRTKLSSTNVKDLERLGALNGLGDTNQMSIFDFEF